MHIYIHIYMYTYICRATPSAAGLFRLLGMALGSLGGFFLTFWEPLWQLGSQHCFHTRSACRTPQKHKRNQNFLRHKKTKREFLPVLRRLCENRSSTFVSPRFRFSESPRTRNQNFWRHKTRSESMSVVRCRQTSRSRQL